jgi:hypothetical protein
MVWPNSSAVKVRAVKSVPKKTVRSMSGSAASLRSKGAWY